MERGDIMAKMKDIKDYQVRESHNKAVDVIIWILLGIWTVVNLFPFYWMIAFSLKDEREVFPCPMLRQTEFVGENFSFIFQ